MGKGQLCKDFRNKPMNQSRGGPSCKVLSGLKALNCVFDSAETMKPIKLQSFPFMVLSSPGSLEKD